MDSELPYALNSPNKRLMYKFLKTKDDLKGVTFFHAKYIAVLLVYRLSLLQFLFVFPMILNFFIVFHHGCSMLFLQKHLLGNVPLQGFGGFLYGI